MVDGYGIAVRKLDTEIGTADTVVGNGVGIAAIYQRNAGGKAADGIGFAYT